MKNVYKRASRKKIFNTTQMAIGISSIFSSFAAKCKPKHPRVNSQNIFVSYHHRFACKQDNKLLKKQTLKFNNDGKNTFNPFCWHLLACAVYIQGIMHHVLSETRHIFLAFISHVDNEMWKGWWGTEGKKLHHLYLFYVLTQKLLFIFVNNKLDTHYELCDTTREWPGI